ncbi:MAG: helix-turn-helix domain-containing protein [Terrimicrobiaceae bacterium]
MPLDRPLMARERIVMRPASRGLRGILQLGRYNHTAARSGLREHLHFRAIEICFLVKGRQTYRVGGKSYVLRGGDVFVTFPDEVHSTGGLPQEKGALYWMVLAVSKKDGPFLGLPEHQGAALLRALRGLPLRHFPGSWKMKEHLDAFTRLYHKPSNPLRACALGNHTIAFLLEVIECSRNPALRIRARPLTPVLDHIQSHLDEPLGVPELAKLAGLSEARFKVRFKEETGIPPGEYVQRTRIDESRRRLLTKGASITRVAFDLGFSSSQYFTTVFKRFTGKSPSDIVR